MKVDRDRRTVWLIGRCDRPGAAALVDEIQTALPEAALLQFDSPAAALAERSPSPELIVVVQQRPSEFATDDVERLVASQPLAELVVAMGAWCASTMRSERVWPESVVVPLWSAPHRLRGLLDVLADRRDRLPLTAGRDEAVVFDLERLVPVDRPPTVSIVTSDTAFGEFLADLCRQAGAELVSPGEDSVGNVIVIDVTTESASRVQSTVTSLRDQQSDCRVVAAVAIPSETETARLHRAGVDCVLPKPFLLSEFSAAIGADEAPVKSV